MTPSDPTPQQKMNPEKEQMLVESYFTKPAPDHVMPEVGVTPRAAYNVVSSEMELDGDPNKNLATFVTTWMEPEAQQLIAENNYRNFIDLVPTGAVFVSAMRHAAGRGAAGWPASSSLRRSATTDTKIRPPIRTVGSSPRFAAA